MRGRAVTICTIVVGVATLASCVTPNVSIHRRNEALWASESAEYTAVVLQVFAGAREKLEEALADPVWTACTEQGPGFETLPPAIIVDLDETVLDNRPFQMHLFRENLAFDEQHWNEWVRDARADAIPGAVEFLEDARRLGVEVFYVTNRDHEVEEPTRQNLATIGLVVNEQIDTVLTKGERAEWVRDKTSRRELVASSYRVLLMLGDDLGDFTRPRSESRAGRHATVVQHREMWGEKWFVLPNPLYGGWVAPTLEGSRAYQ